MKNYELRTIVPVGTKIVRTKEHYQLRIGEVYTVKESNEYDVYVEGYDECYIIECFAPYIEEEVQVEIDSLPTYVALKSMPYVSKGAILVDRTQKGNSIIVVSNTCSAYGPGDETTLSWLLKEHPEDFKKIN